MMRAAVPGKIRRRGSRAKRSRSTPRPRIRLAPDQRRDMLLASLERVITRTGYQGATVPAVVAEAGVAQGCFYRYFPNIDAAFLEAVRRLLPALREAAAGLNLARVRDIRDLEEELVVYFRVLSARLAEHAALLGEALLVAPAAAGPVGREMSAFLVDMHGVARDLLARHSGRAPFRELDAEVTAAAVVGMILGSARDAVRAGSSFDPGRWAAEMARFEAGALAATPPTSAPRRRASRGDGASAKADDRENES
jgi:AcrR family transcriptional regulator